VHATFSSEIKPNSTGKHGVAHRKMAVIPSKSTLFDNNHEVEATKQVSCEEKGSFFSQILLFS